ncbi:MAG TPA: hypothetical protein VLH12_08385 [Usitatibacter sp.]|nr:hypothetical protein [Usitatibacter sp.]
MSTSDHESDPKVVMNIAGKIIDFLDSDTASTPLEKIAALAVAKVAIEEANNAQFAAILRANMNNQTRGRR